MKTFIDGDDETWMISNVLYLFYYFWKTFLYQYAKIYQKNINKFNLI